VLLTRSRLCPRASPGSSLHLHVLSTPPAFVLSQDQTLREELLGASPKAHTRHKELSWTMCGTEYTVAPRSMTGQSQVRRARLGDRRIEPGRTPSRGSDSGAHAVEFSKTATPCREGDSFSRGATGRDQQPARTAEYSAQPAKPPRASTAGAPPQRPRHCSASQDSTCTETIRSRGRSSKSTRTTCCQVPSPSSPPTIGMVSLGPMRAARRWLWAFVSWLRTLCS
jgi:hypothetical protein